MKRKLWALILAICACFCLFVACGETSTQSSNESKIVKLVDSEISLNVGDHYRLKTDDGILYDTYESDNIAVCTVSQHGEIVAVGSGTATVSVTTESGKLSCTVTVTVTTEEKTDSYHITLSYTDTVAVGDSVKAVAKVKKNGVACTESVVWQVTGTAAEHTANGNELTLAGKNKGFCEVKATIDGFDSSFTLKVYDETCILATPVFGLQENVLQWTAVENAVSYRVSLDGGQSWQETTQTSITLMGGLNPLGVAVVALADKSSQYVNSTYELTNTYAVTENNFENALKNAMVTEESGEYTVVSTTKVAYGNSLFYVYGDENALFDNDGNIAMFADAAIAFEVKGKIGETLYIVSSAGRSEAVASFTLTEEYQTVGYRLNAFGEMCYVSASDSVTVKNVRLERNRMGCAYASVESANESIQFIDDAFTKKALAFSGGYKELGTDYKAKNGEEYQMSAIGISVDNDYHGGLLDFTLFVPESDLGYDYFVWNIWAEKAGSFIIKQKEDWTQVSKPLSAGWNEVKISYADISNDICQLLFQEKNFGGQPETIMVKLGTMKGVKGVPFLNKSYSSANFMSNDAYQTKDSYTLSADDQEYSCESMQVTVDNDYHGALLDFTSFVPTEDNENGYVWRIWSEKAGSIIIKQKEDWTQKQVTLVAGWNEVRLTYEDMTDDLFQVLIQEKNFEGQPETVVLKFGALLVNTTEVNLEAGNNDFNDPFVDGRKKETAV